MGNQTDPFVRYYADESLKPSTMLRFVAAKAAVERAAGYFGLPKGRWQVADIGCGAATQCSIWAKEGHSVFGTDINAELIALGRKRAAAAGLDMDLTVGSATQLPWRRESMDICLCPELLEHVADWQLVIKEAIRVLKPGGLLFLSTTNKLCPLQEEFDLPGYSWYPGPVKRHFEALAMTSKPELVNYAKFPAVNWFSYFGLARHLRAMNLRSMDRFDVAALAKNRWPARTVLAVICAFPPARWLAHVATPYTMVFAQKSPN